MSMDLLLDLVGASIAAIVGWFIWRHRYYRGARSLTALMLSLFLWCTARLMQVFASSPEALIFWNTIQFGGIVMLGPAWFLLSLAYSGQWWRTYRWFRRGLFIPSAIFFAFALSNNLHGLWWSSVQLDTAAVGPYLLTTPGPIFWLHQIYHYTCVLAGLGLLFHAAFIANHPDRRFIIPIIAALLLSLLGTATLTAAFALPGIAYPLPWMVLFAALVACYNTIAHRLVDLGPLAEREVFSGLPDGMIVLDSRGNIAEMNAIALQMLQLGEQHWSGRNLNDVLRSSPLQAEVGLLLAEQGMPRSRQVVRETHADVLALELRLRPLLAANGVSTGSLLLLRDVSEGVRAERERSRRVAEQNLISAVARVANSASETEDLIRSVAATILAGSTWERVIVGLVNHSETEIVVVADEIADAASDTALRPDQTISDDIAALMTPRAARMIGLQEGEFADTVWAECLRSSKMHNMLAVPLYQRDTPLGLLILLSAQPMHHEDERLQLAETIGELIIDAIVRTRLYDEVRRAERLKAVFLAGVSHEFRTPLTTIIGYCEMLQRGIFGEPPEAMDEVFANMRYSSITLMQLINDILDFSRMEAGHLKIDLQPVDLRWTIHAVEGQVQPQIRERDLALQVEIADDLPLAHADMRRIEQVLSNLVANAIKFSDNGTITIRAGMHTDRVRLSVIDTGIGIAPENLEAIFDEFRRVETPNGRRYTGSGLGLAIVRSLVQMMGGHVGVESTPGVGSHFYVDLMPANAPSAVQTQVLARTVA